MIRSVHIPRGVSRMGSLGLVQAGAGGSAGAYQFDSTGLSADPRLSYYLQNLTPGQLQSALDGRDPTGELQRLLQLDQSGADLPCGTPESGDPYCNGGQPQGGGILNGLLSTIGSVPTWAWVTGAGAVAALLLIPRK